MGAPFSSTKFSTSRPASVSLCLVNNTSSLNTFSGYYGTVRFDDGKDFPVYVINERAEIKFADGTSGPAIKVCYGQRYLVGDGHRYAVRYCNSTGYWIKASRLISRKAA